MAFTWKRALAIKRALDSQKNDQRDLGAKHKIYRVPPASRAEKTVGDYLQQIKRLREEAKATKI